LLDENIQHVSVLVDGTPKIVTLALTRDKALVEVLRVTQPSSAMPQLSRKLLTKLQTPLADRLGADGYPTLGPPLFTVPEAEAKAGVKPDGRRNDLRRKAVATLWGRLCVHRG
jgi:hypothetical protein